MSDLDVYKKVWSGRHRGISWEIQQHSLGSEHYPNGVFCSYIYFDERSAADDYFDRCWEKVGNYFDSPLADLPWHCGITYCKKEMCFERGVRFIKAGCDYNHYWDEGSIYDEAHVLGEIVEVIDALHNRTKLKLWSFWDGNFYFEDELSEAGKPFAALNQPPL